MRDFTAAHNDYLDPDRHLNPEEMEPFVEEDTTTDAERLADAKARQRFWEIEAAAERQIAELMADTAELCPQCGAKMEWVDGDDEVGQADYWSCTECENWEKPS